MYVYISMYIEGTVYTHYFYILCYRHVFTCICTTYMYIYLYYNKDIYMYVYNYVACTQRSSSP